MDEKKYSLTITVDETLSKLTLKIKRLKEVDVDKHKYEIQFFEYLQNNFIRLADFHNQICNLIPYYQNEIGSNWDDVTDKKLELKKKKQEVEILKKQVASTQSEEINLQDEKKKLSQQLKEDELDLNQNQKKFNKKGEKLEKLYSKLGIVSKLKEDPKDTFLNKFFESRNKFQAKRLNRFVLKRQVESNDLSEQIQTKQEQIAETSEGIDYQQKRLRELQIENIKLRNEVHKILYSIKETEVGIQKTENEIDEHNSILRELSLSLVEIANETSRQHSLYQKSCLAPLDDTDYGDLLNDSIFSNIISEDVEELLASEKFLPQASDTED